LIAIAKLIWYQVVWVGVKGGIGRSRGLGIFPQSKIPVYLIFTSIFLSTSTFLTTVTGVPNLNMPK